MLRKQLADIEKSHAKALSDFGQKAKNPMLLILGANFMQVAANDEKLAANCDDLVKDLMSKKDRMIEFEKALEESDNDE
jgi:hypothetical protein